MKIVSATDTIFHPSVLVRLSSLEEFDQLWNDPRTLSGRRALNSLHEYLPKGFDPDRPDRDLYSYTGEASDIVNDSLRSLQIPYERYRERDSSERQRLEYENQDLQDYQDYLENSMMSDEDFGRHLDSSEDFENYRENFGPAHTWEDVVDHLDKQHKQYRVRRPIKVYRGAQLEHVFGGEHEPGWASNEDLTGWSFIDPAYMSFSVHPGQAYEFAGTSKGVPSSRGLTTGTTPVVFRTVLKPGFPAVSSDIHQESEVVGSRGTSWKVLRDRGFDKQGRRHLDIEATSHPHGEAIVQKRPSPSKRVDEGKRSREKAWKDSLITPEQREYLKSLGYKYYNPSGAPPVWQRTRSDGLTHSIRVDGWMDDYGWQSESNEPDGSLYHSFRTQHGRSPSFEESLEDAKKFDEGTLPPSNYKPEDVSDNDHRLILSRGWTPPRDKNNTSYSKGIGTTLFQYHQHPGRWVTVDWGNGLENARQEHSSLSDALNRFR